MRSISWNCRDYCEGKIIIMYVTTCNRSSKQLSENNQQSFHSTLLTEKYYIILYTRNLVRNLVPYPSIQSINLENIGISINSNNDQYLK